MKKFFFLLVPYLFLVITGCHENINSPNSNNSDSFFPVTKGNEWNFSRTQTDSLISTTRVLDEYLLNNQKYYLVTFDGAPADTISIENNIVYRLKNNLKKQWLNFNSRNNETYYYGEAIVTVQTNQTVSTNFGEFNDCISFSFNVPALADEEMTYYFSKGVGLVKIQSAWMILLLKDYKLY